jgi:GNAT superfamily N-acetyltransferase
MFIRLLTPADAEPYHTLRLRMLRSCPDAFGSEAGEEAAKPLSWVEDRLVARDIPPAKFVLGAFADDGTLVGSVGVIAEDKGKYRHKATLFGMFTAPEAQRQGTGRALVREALRRARVVRGLEQLLLTVTEGNFAEELYASEGFRRFGVEPRAIKLDGRYFAKVHMVCLL